MKERPILFSGAMVRAILEGRKTQTRRVVKDPICTNKEIYADAGLTWYGNFGLRKPCKFGDIGDRLWVRETAKYKRYGGLWVFDVFDHAEANVIYEADKESKYFMLDSDTMKKFKEGKKPSIFMPRWASRITLEIVSVRVESLVDISEHDAKAEGIEQDENKLFKCYTPKAGWLAIDDPVESYKTLWDSINGMGSWYDNPWVWVIEFKKVEVAK